MYRKIIEHNYMGHDEIDAGLRELFQSRTQTNRLLDLGCGDAELPSRYLALFPLNEYHGVDLAADPLALARKNLAAFPSLSVHLHQTDQAAFSAQTELDFDLIVLGFALHHHPWKEKTQLMNTLRSRLTPGGQLIMYDVANTRTEPRNAFFDRYLKWIQNDWTQFTEREHELISNHIQNNDHPEPVEALLELGHNTGFTNGRHHLSCANDFHHLLTFST